MPRAYRKRADPPAEDGAKERILQAACEMLMRDDGFSGFTVEAVAVQADVARATVYYQFGSKGGLLEAVHDHIAARSGVFPLAVRSQSPEALGELVRGVAAFWSAERALTRRFYGLAALDPDVRRSVAARDEERRAGARAAVEGWLRSQGRFSKAALDEGSAIAYTLIRFETFDALAGEAPLASVAPTILRLIERALE